MKRALVCGAGGFIGGHLADFLKKEGYWVRGVDIKEHEHRKLNADEFKLLDLREFDNCRKALDLNGEPFDEVYQLAADMGGMGFIHSAETEIMRNNVLINIHMIQAACEKKCRRYFFSSSVCVYRDMKRGEPEMTEAQAYPAMPDNEYGWEKLYSERAAISDSGADSPVSELLRTLWDMEGRKGKSPRGHMQKGGRSQRRRNHRGMGRRNGSPVIYLVFITMSILPVLKVN